MNILKELWYGNIDPQESDSFNTPELKELLGKMARCHEKLEQNLTEEQKEVFDQFADAQNEYASLGLEQAFEYGFWLGVNMMLQVVR